MFDSVLTEPVWKQRLREAIKVLKELDGDRYYQYHFCPFVNFECGCAAHYIAEAFDIRSAAVRGVGPVAEYLAAGNAGIYDNLYEMFAAVSMDFGIRMGPLARDMMVVKLEQLLND